MLAGFGGTMTQAGVKRRLRRGARITVVDWCGCMAHIRKELYVGKIVKTANQREKFGARADSIECVVVERPDGTEDWQPVERVRFVRNDIEIWT